MTWNLAARTKAVNNHSLLANKANSPWKSVDTCKTSRVTNHMHEVD